MQAKPRNTRSWTNRASGRQADWTIRAVLNRVETVEHVLSYSIPSQRRRLADHPYQSAICDAIVVFYPGCAERYDRCSARATVVEYFSGEERVLQDIVDEMLMQGVWNARSSRLLGDELFGTRSNIRLAITATLSAKECERAAGVINAKATKELAKRRRVRLRAPELPSFYHAFTPYRVPAPVDSDCDTKNPVIQ